MTLTTLQRSLALGCVLLAGLCGTAQGQEDPPMPERVYAYHHGFDNEGHWDNGVPDTSHTMGTLYVYQQLGLLDDQGLLPDYNEGAGTFTRSGSDEVVGHAILANNGNIIGIRSADGTVAAYNLSTTQVDFNYAFQRVKCDGELFVIGHGTARQIGPGSSCDDHMATGGIQLGYRYFNGFGAGTGRSHAWNTPCTFQTRPGCSIKVRLIVCHSDEDPDGDGPKVSVKQSLMNIPNSGISECTAAEKCVAMTVWFESSSASQAEKARFSNKSGEWARKAGVVDVHGRPDRLEWFLRKGVWGLDYYWRSIINGLDTPNIKLRIYPAENMPEGVDGFFKPIKIDPVLDVDWTATSCQPFVGEDGALIDVYFPEESFMDEYTITVTTTGDSQIDLPEGQACLGSPVVIDVPGFDWNTWNNEAWITMEIPQNTPDPDGAYMVDSLGNMTLLEDAEFDFAMRMAYIPVTTEGTYFLMGPQPQVCPSDFNVDLEVDIQDLLALLGNWGDLENEHDAGDTDGNGDVDVHDLMKCISQWGPCSGD